MKNRLEVYTDEYNNYTNIYLNARLVYKSDYIKSHFRLRELINEIKEPLDNCEVVVHSYKNA